MSKKIKDNLNNNNNKSCSNCIYFDRICKYNTNSQYYCINNEYVLHTTQADKDLCDLMCPLKGDIKHEEF